VSDEEATLAEIEEAGKKLLQKRKKTMGTSSDLQEDGQEESNKDEDGTETKQRKKSLI